MVADQRADGGTASEPRGPQWWLLWVGAVVLSLVITYAVLFAIDIRAGFGTQTYEQLVHERNSDYVAEGILAAVISTPWIVAALRDRERGWLMIVGLGPSLLIIAVAIRSPFVKVDSNPDPGGQVLHAMAADPVFSIRAAGATHARIKLQPAAYRDNGFWGSTWDSPSVELAFNAPAPALSVFAFYAKYASTRHWIAIHSGRESENVADTWEATVAPCTQARLTLFDTTVRDSRSYELVMVPDTGLPSTDGC